MVLNDGLFFIKNNDDWFIKIRIIITFLAIIPLFLIFFLFKKSMT